MNKVLFIHDGPRWKNTKGEYFGSQADIDMYKRYLFLGEQVEFVMRVFKVYDENSLVNLSEQGISINEIKPFNRPQLLLNYWKSKNKIKNCIREADLLVIRLPSTIGSVALNYARAIKKPYLVEVVACPWDSLRNHSLLGKMYAYFSKLKLKKLVYNSPYVVYVTSMFLQERYPCKNNSIGISDVVIKDRIEENLKLNSYKSFNKNNSIKLGSIGVVNLKYKGHHYVLNAISKLVHEGFDIEYYIIGGGDNKRLKNLSSNLKLDKRVHFLGKLPHENIFSILDNNIDIYVHPSETEGLPRALVEAMSRGCACIGARVGGIPELLHNEALFKSKNTLDLVLKIKSFFNPHVLIQNSKANFEKSKSFRFEVLAKNRKLFYNQFLNSVHEEKDINSTR